MKKLLMITVYALVFIFFTGLTNSYSQPPQEAGLSVQEMAILDAGLTPVREGKIGVFSSSFLDRINAEKDTYYNTPISKASDGLINATTFWTEIPREVVDTSEESTVLEGLTVGLGKGLIFGIGRGMAGVYDTVTAPVPPYNEPVVNPDYKVENPNRDGYKITLLRW